MADLYSIAQVVYDQAFPNATVQTAVKFEHVMEEAKLRYAVELWLQSKIQRNTEGEWEIPSALWREGEIEVKDGQADISSLQIFRSNEGDIWFGKLGGFDCDCEYMRMSLNQSKMLCDDEYIGNSKPVIVIGKTLKFPKGAHADKIPIIYASNGNDLEDELEVDDTIGGLVSDYLWKRFTNKIPVDRTNNSNENI